MFRGDVRSASPHRCCGCPWSKIIKAAKTHNSHKSWKPWDAIKARKTKKQEQDKAFMWGYTLRYPVESAESATKTINCTPLNCPVLAAYIYSPLISWPAPNMRTNMLRFRLALPQPWPTLLRDLRGGVKFAHTLLGTCRMLELRLLSPASTSFIYE